MVKLSWRLLRQAALFASGAVCYALLGILSQLSKSEDGTYAYSMPSVVLTAEAVKLLMSCTFLVAECGSVPKAGRVLARGTFWQWIAFAVPSVMYALNNMLDMLNNLYMDPATEQVLVQGKILTTGVVWWLVFREPMGARKWFSLLVLFVGAVISGLPSKSSGEEKTMYIEPFGVLLIVLYCLNSAGAGVYNEWLYKGVGKDDSIHVCNIKLYTLGVLFLSLAHFGSSGASLSGLYQGYNRYVWALVATYVCMGLVLSQVVKHFGSIAKLFTSCSSMYVAAVLAWSLFGYAPTAKFLTGMGLITAAMLAYNVEKIFVQKQSKSA